jgi:hypothetical protein
MIELKLTKACIADCTQSGDIDEIIDGWAYTMRNQFDKLDPDAIRSELRGTGAWDAEDLADDYANRRRLLFVAAGECRYRGIRRWFGDN